MTLQSFEADHAYLSHVKVIYVPFKLVYGSLISSRGYRVTDQNVPGDGIKRNPERENFAMQPNAR